MTVGTDTVLLRVDRSATVEVGALGKRRFEPGAYAYTGSAFGPGGFARVERHRRLAESDDGTRHWHVDSLLPLATIQDVFTAEGDAIECVVARALPGERITGFGATDCGCDSHLAYAREGSELHGGLASPYEEPTDHEAD